MAAAYAATAQQRNSAAVKPWTPTSILRPLLTTVGTLWLGYMLYSVLAQQGVRYFLPQYPGAFAGATLLLLLSMLCSSGVFYWLVNADPNVRFNLRQVYILHHIGQVLRHLPGRFWGFAYQLDASPQPEQRAMLANANIMLMLLSLSGTLVATLLVLGWQQQLPRSAAWGSALLGVIFMLLLLKRGIRSLLFIIRKLLPARWYQRLNQQIAVRDLVLSSTQCGKILCLISFSWLLYFWAWQLLATAFPMLVELDLLVLAAWYSLAWLAGFLSAITPGGIGIREGSFFLLSDGLANLNLLVFLAAFMRLWFMLADLFFGLFAWLLARDQSPT
jgi:glycosyltransferase 2 family protein